MRTLIIIWMMVDLLICKVGLGLVVECSSGVLIFNYCLPNFCADSGS